AACLNDVEDAAQQRLRRKPPAKMAAITRCLIAVWTAALLPGVAVPVPPEEAPAAAAEHFEKTVRPLLAGRCWRCHGPRRQKGGLRLDSADALAQGGGSGPVVVPGQPD